MSRPTRVARLSLHRLEIPFRARFKHASAERSCTETVWVEARSTSGEVGYGEGCPRSYVTREDLASAGRWLRARVASIQDEVADLQGLRAWMRSHRAEIDANPAAWCAVELALLDLLARDAGVSVEQLLGLPRLAGTFQYSAVLGDCDVALFAQTFARFRDRGFRDYKLKLSGDLARDHACLDIVQRAGGPDLRVRLDANNLWRRPEQAARYLASLESEVFAIEEPLAAGDLAGLAELRAQSGLPVILDESLLRVDQVEALPGAPEGWIANLRVSKLGGLLRSLDVLAVARRRGVRVVVGAQVGETSLLTRAGLTLAAQAGDALIAQEGGYGTLLLTHDVCEPALQLGDAGRLEIARALPADPRGFGLDVHPPQRALHPL